MGLIGSWNEQKGRQGVGGACDLRGSSAPLLLPLKTMLHRTDSRPILNLGALVGLSRHAAQWDSVPSSATATSSYQS